MWRHQHPRPHRVRAGAISPRPPQVDYDDWAKPYEARQSRIVFQVGAIATSGGRELGDGRGENDKDVRHQRRHLARGDAVGREFVGGGGGRRSLRHQDGVLLWSRPVRATRVAAHWAVRHVLAAPVAKRPHGSASRQRRRRQRPRSAWWPRRARNNERRRPPPFECFSGAAEQKNRRHRDLRLAACEVDAVARGPGRALALRPHVRPGKSMGAACHDGDVPGVAKRSCGHHQEVLDREVQGTLGAAGCQVPLARVQQRYRELLGLDHPGGPEHLDRRLEGEGMHGQFPA
mmetsp:Transcript_12549/g.33683  ORF Transcript_12549/g.33683 Transcript_12549/m.33683 type:complete len:289 (-) Transcript_12549:1281-2147(-)